MGLMTRVVRTNLFETCSNERAPDLLRLLEYLSHAARHGRKVADNRKRIEVESCCLVYVGEHPAGLAVVVFV